MESLTKTASPTIAQTNYKYDRNHDDATKTTAATATASELLDTESKDVDQAAASRKTSTSIDFTFNKIGKDKRSLFDIDNASSLSLAEKLRNEANKYSADSTGDVQTSDVVAATVINVGGHTLAKLQTAQATAEAQQQDEEDTDRQNDSTPSSPIHHAMTERRPSWRLKFDAGCKVRKNSVISHTHKKKKFFFLFLLFFFSYHILVIFNVIFVYLRY